MHAGIPLHSLYMQMLQNVEHGVTLYYVTCIRI